MPDNTHKKEKKLIKKHTKVISGFDYPKLAFLLLMIIIAYFTFSNPKVISYVSTLNNWGYLGVFVAGMLFTFGFTAPLSAGFFIALAPENLWLAGIIGGFGAMLGDILIFKFIRFSFMDEFQKLKRTRIMREVSRLIEKTVRNKIKIYLMYIFAGILISSPLPDEAGIILLAGLTKIETRILALTSFILNTLGILILLHL